MWSASNPDDDTLSYEVYLGTSETPSFYAETTTTETVASLEPDTRYY
jgi:hypothetical protein